MESFLVGSVPHSSSITSGGKLLRSKHCANKNIYNASMSSTFNLYNANDRLFQKLKPLDSYVPKLSQHKRKTKIEYTILRPRLCLNNHYKHTGGESAHQENDKKYVVKAVAGPSFGYESQPSNHESILDSVKKFLVGFYMLVAPYSYAANGRILCTISASLLAVEKLSDISPLFFTSVLKAIICHHLLGIYLAVVNQLFDIDIDKINKPYLPFASGQLSPTTGVIIVTSSLILSVYLAWSTGSWPLICNILLSSAVWTAYSINAPLLRWKKNPVIAPLCYISTMALSNPVGDFLHMQTSVFKRPAIFPRSLKFFTVFMTLYIVGIAALKDVPDVEGDKEFGINSFSVLFGQERVFWFCVTLLEMAFGVGLLVGATSSCLRSKIITVLGHVVLALVLWLHAKVVDFRSITSISSFYMLTWKLLYAEYFLMLFL